MKTAALLRRPLVRKLPRDLYAEMECMSVLATAIQDGYQGGCRERVKELLRRAIAGGELRPMLD
jgi:hypothetical protein